MLTLPPYGFYWFELCVETQAPRLNVEPAEQLPEFDTLVWRSGEALLNVERREVLARTILPKYLGMRRWFAAKDKALRAARLSYAIPLHGSAGGAPLLLCEVEASFDEGAERYMLPLSIAWDTPGMPPLPVQLALARVRRGHRVGFLTDAFALVSFAHAMCDAIAQRAVLRANEETIECTANPQLEHIARDENMPIQWLTTEQSNSTLVMGESMVLKLIRRVRGGIHPEAEMGRHLTECGYPNIPPWLGDMIRRDAAGVPHTLAVLQGFVPNQGDAWQWAFDTLSRLTADLLHEDAHDTDYLEAVDGYTQFIGTIGRRLGELHVVLARPSEDPAFHPRRADRADRNAWEHAIQSWLIEALDRIAAHTQWPDEACAQIAERLTGLRKPLLSKVRRLVADAAGTSCQRVHGDFHLGQVLVVQGDAYLIDFEGEPALSLEQRRQKTSPLRDVAALLRSLEYVTAAVAGNEEQVVPATRERQNAILQDCLTRATQAFLNAYRAVVADASPALAACASRAALLDAFLLEKAAYEVCYEFVNRPAWVGVPLRGLDTLALRLLAQEAEISNVG